MTMIKIIITTNNIAFPQSLNGSQSIRQGVNYSTAVRNLHFAKTLLVLFNPQSLCFRNFLSIYIF